MTNLTWCILWVTQLCLPSLWYESGMAHKRTSIIRQVAAWTNTKSLPSLTMNLCTNEKYLMKWFIIFLPANRCYLYLPGFSRCCLCWNFEADGVYWLARDLVGIVQRMWTSPFFWFDLYALAHVRAGRERVWKTPDKAPELDNPICSAH